MKQRLMAFGFKSFAEEQEMGLIICSQMQDGKSYQDSVIKAAELLAQRAPQEAPAENDELDIDMGKLRIRPLKRKKRGINWPSPEEVDLDMDMKRLRVGGQKAGANNIVDNYVKDILEEVNKIRKENNKSIVSNASEINKLVGFELCLGLQMGKQIGEAIDMALSDSARQSIIQRALPNIQRKRVRDALDVDLISNEARALMVAQEQRQQTFSARPPKPKRVRRKDFEELERRITGLQFGQGKKKEKLLFDFFDL